MLQSAKMNIPAQSRLTPSYRQTLLLSLTRMNGGPAKVSCCTGVALNGENGHG